ncbi:hypothetical protein ES703_90851 [subsurface metagenome]
MSKNKTPVYVVTSGDMKDYLWLVKTDKGDFFITVMGNWTQEEAAKRVKAVFDVMLKLDITAMIPRKRVTGPDDAMGTIYQQLEPKDELDFAFLGGKKLWQVCGRGAEYDAELIRSKKEMEEEIKGLKHQRGTG